ncbi:bifunctional demethylmenaquinone methyltransferase/2-methoxy-6-polyprenyl-1,4-benzoquinol methylase UbiE [bacterium]|nr:bifunctional demethylmenaquinone methyltransferase/2-methoxy-6-polyprenyl-1,4-benzoquinol methylase UbiE [bacterium]
MNTIKPYKDRSDSKKEQVADMFDGIAGRYDALNRILSLGIDVGWRKKLVRTAALEKPAQILDVATGTADLALELAKTTGAKVIGVDISKGMLEIGRAKVGKERLNDQIELLYGDSESLPFESDRFDVVTASFGVRNFQNLEVGLSEMARVLKPGGLLMVLEFSQPQSSPFKELYRFYSSAILPRLGKALSGDGSAYAYLPESVNAFPYGAEFNRILDLCGLQSASDLSLTFGIASLYTARK